MSFKRERKKTCPRCLALVVFYITAARPCILSDCKLHRRIACRESESRAYSFECPNCGAVNRGSIQMCGPQQAPVAKAVDYTPDIFDGNEKEAGK